MVDFKNGTFDLHLNKSPGGPGARRYCRAQKFSLFFPSMINNGWAVVIDGVCCSGLAYESKPDNI